MRRWIRRKGESVPFGRVAKLIADHAGLKKRGA
jgi:hypothetical protein